MEKLMKWKIEQSDLDKWTRLDQHCTKSNAVDCAINTSAFLNILDRDTAEKLAREKNILHNPTYGSELMQLFYNEYVRNTRRNPNTIMKEIPLDHQLLNPLIQMLGPNHGTMINFNRHNSIGHSMIAAVSKDNQLVLIDPQQMELFVGNETIVPFLVREKFVSFSLYFITREKRVRNETEIQLRKQTTDRKTKRRRIMEKVLPSRKRSRNETNTMRNTMRKKKRMRLERISSTKKHSSN